MKRIKNAYKEQFECLSDAWHMWLIGYLFTYFTCFLFVCFMAYDQQFILPEFLYVQFIGFLIISFTWFVNIFIGLPLLIYIESFFDGK